MNKLKTEKNIKTPIEFLVRWIVDHKEIDCSYMDNVNESNIETLKELKSFYPNSDFKSEFDEVIDEHIDDQQGYIDDSEVEEIDG